MFKSFYHLRESPFNITSDPSFFFTSRRHKEALSHLIYGIESRKGFLEITGEIGTGKTTLCRVLLNMLDIRRTKSAFILNPDLSGIQLFQAIMDDYGLRVKSDNKIEIYRRLNKFLISELESNNNVVLIIDEAQNMGPGLLEEIRLISNLETEKEKLIQIVLVGQPQLKEALNSCELTQLRQRISVRYHMLPLDEDEVEPYITHRLKIAGAKQGEVFFEEDVISEIFSYSLGTPRLINTACDKLLLLGFVEGKKHFTREMAQRCISELEGVFA